MATNLDEQINRGSGAKDDNDWQSKLSVVVPAFNEENGISETLKDLRLIMPRAEIIVVDDGSLDQTATVAAEFDGVTVLRHQFNKGYGAAIKTGANAAARPLIAWFDADHQHRAEDLAVMSERLNNERLAAVIGQRKNPTQTVLRTVGKGLMRILASALNASVAKDLNCGLRVFQREVLMDYLGVLPNGFSASTTSTMILFSQGYPTGLHPIHLNKRIGTSKVIFRDGIAALTLILRIVMLVAPLRIFMRGGIAIAFIGILYGSAIALIERSGFPVAGAGVTTFGLLLCFLGLIADQVSQVRLEIINHSAERRRDD